MRSFINIILAIFLIVVTAGVTISRHYCGGELAAISLDQEPEPCCDMEGACCHNELEVFHLDSDFLAPEQGMNPLSNLAHTPFQMPTELIPKLLSGHQTIHPPQDLPHTQRSRYLALRQSFLL